jgi:hypothetical protein
MLTTPNTSSSFFSSSSMTMLCIYECGHLSYILKKIIQLIRAGNLVDQTEIVFYKVGIPTLSPSQLELVLQRVPYK